MKPHEEPHEWIVVFKGTESQCRRFANHLKAGGTATRVIKKMGYHQVYAKQYKLHRFREGLQP